MLNEYDIYLFGREEKWKEKSFDYVTIIWKCGGDKDLSFCVGLKAPFTNNNVSKEEKVLGKAP